MHSRREGWGRIPCPCLAIVLIATVMVPAAPRSALAQLENPVPADERGTIDAERSGFHDAANIRTVFWNYGMVGDYPADPGNVDLSVFHSCEVPKGSGMNYSDGITPFVLAKIRQNNGREAFIMETGFRERQAPSPNYNRTMRFEPRPGYFQADPARNPGRSPAISSDPRTWPDFWPDQIDDPDDPGWAGSWNGYFGKRPAADQESYMVMDDDFYDAWDFNPDSRDTTRRGLGLRIEVRGFQWANPQAGNVIFWHYDITNEGTTDYDDNIIFGLYMDSGVGGSGLSCDGIFESDDDNAFFNRRFDENVINLVYTWDKYGHGRDLSGNCGRTGYLGYAYLETPGNHFDGIDNDEDGIVDERRDGGPGEKIVGQEEIRAAVEARYDLTRFEIEYGPLDRRPAYRAGVWWTGDEDLDWVAELHDTGADGVLDTGDTGEGDGMPTDGEPYFDRTDLNESDQIGLTGFKMNRIKAGQGNPDPEVDGIVFYTDSANWPQRLYEKFTDPDPANRFDPELVANYNIGFLFASGAFTLKAGQTERFSLALAYGGDLDELRRTVRTVQQIYDANYQFAVPPPMPTASAESGDGYVRLSWDDVAERGVDPVTGEYDFEGYRIYRSTDPDFLDARVITTGTGSGYIGNGRPIAQFDLKNGKHGYTEQTQEGVAYYLGQDTGLVHTWTDSTVTNGQEYYYAVTAYDYGPKALADPSASDSVAFYPSENPITVSRTLRGGTILPKNTVRVRPEPKVLGYEGASVAGLTRISGDGVGTSEVRIVNGNLVPDDHLMAVTFQTSHPESVRAESYTLRDSTDQVTLFTTGRDLEGEGSGPVGAGLLPVIRTLREVEVDSTRSGFTAQGPTDARLSVTYLRGTQLPSINQIRPGFPEDITITFSDTDLDTSLAAIGLPARPAKFRIVAHGPNGDHQMNFRFRDPDQNGTLSAADEYIDIVTYLPLSPTPTTPRVTWRLQLDLSAAGGTLPQRLPGVGDQFELVLRKPFGAEDAFVFRTKAQGATVEAARQAAFEPYVVPNPYVGAASFEPERFAVSGRGERRIEFRGLPAHCTIRIYTVRGDLVQTLRHDGSYDGYVAWNLRTRDNLDLAPGLYVFHVDAGPLGKSIGKFAVVK